MLTVAAGETEGTDKLIEELQRDALKRLEPLAQQVGDDVIRYLRELIAERQAPWPDPAGPGRQERRGHWADRSGELARSYRVEVERDSQSVRLVLRNDSDHAFWVEVMDGLFVLSGVLEPGGPVDHAFREIAARVAPDFEIVVGDVETVAD